MREAGVQYSVQTQRKFQGGRRSVEVKYCFLSNKSKIYSHTFLAEYASNFTVYHKSCPKGVWKGSRVAVGDSTNMPSPQVLNVKPCFLSINFRSSFP